MKKTYLALALWAATTGSAVAATGQASTSATALPPSAAHITFN